MRLRIFGAPGAGKTTLAHAIASRYGVAHRQQDDEFWRPGWVIAPQCEFLEALTAFAGRERWVIDGNYISAEPIMRSRASAVLWIDLPLVVTYPRVLKRTVNMYWTQREVCGGNRESLTKIFSRHGMPAYALLNHRRIQRRLETFWHQFDGPKLRLTRRKALLTEATRFCDALD